MLLEEAARFKAEVARLKRGPLPPGPVLRSPPSPASSAKAPARRPGGPVVKMQAALPGAKGAGAREQQGEQEERRAQGGEAEEKLEREKRLRGSSGAESSGRWTCLPPAKRSSGKRPSTGADMPPESREEEQQGEPWHWPAWKTHSGKWHEAGYKVHIQDLPRDMSRRQLDAWFAKQNCPAPSDVNPFGLSPFGRLQVVLTFDCLEKAARAKDVLRDSDLEPGKHRTQTKWFQSSEF